MTGLSNGQVVVLYSPITSLNGAKLLLNKGPPRKRTIEDVSDAMAAPTILTPHALPMFRDLDPGRGTKRKREKDRMDPRKSHRPELPVTGPGKGGRVGASATQHVVQNLVRDTTRDIDVSLWALDWRPLAGMGKWDYQGGPSLLIIPLIDPTLLAIASDEERDTDYRSFLSPLASPGKHCSGMQTTRIRSGLQVSPFVSLEHNG